MVVVSEIEDPPRAIRRPEHESELPETGTPLAALRACYRSGHPGESSAASFDPRTEATQARSHLGRAAITTPSNDASVGGPRYLGRFCEMQNIALDSISSDATFLQLVKYTERGKDF